MRHRVHGSPSADGFLNTGKQNMEDIHTALTQVGRDLDAFQEVLDFGCGCGRTLRWFVERGQSWQLYGTDVDAQAVSWCRHNLASVSFGVNPPMPPLDYPDDMFDLVLAISVFTHLNEDYQFRWLEELSRILRPNGILLLTVHGYDTWKGFPRQEVVTIEKEGFYFRITNVRKGIFPEWYQSSYHSKKYVLREYSKYFDILKYIENGLDPGGDYQDVVICRKA
jgi:SAM-dependent methyltransferase